MNLEGLTHYWNQWNDRERVLVVLATLCLGVYLLYALLYAPLNSALARYQDQLSTQKTTLQWMQNVKRQYQQSAETPQSLTSNQLLTVLGQQLAISPFHPYAYQLEQTSAGDIQLAFAAVPYNDFLVWFKQFNTHYALTIKQLSAERTTTPGMVKLSVDITT